MRRRLNLAGKALLATMLVVTGAAVASSASPRTTTRAEVAGRPTSTGSEQTGQVPHENSVVIANASTKTVAFTGHYAGHVTLLIDNGSVTISSVTGKGTASLLGTSTVVGNGSASASSQCDPFSGTGSITGRTGRLLLSVSESKSSGCSSGESGPVTVTFSGVANVTGGSGVTKGAKGILKFSGALKLGGTSGSQDGPYKVTITGKLTLES